MAFYLLNASKKGVSAHQLEALDPDYKSAWFMCHRIREAMRSGGFGPLGGEGKIVEADETYLESRETPHVSPQARWPPLYQGRQTPRTVVLSSLLWSAAGMSAHSMCRSPTSLRWQDRAREYRERDPRAHRRKRALHWRGTRLCGPTKRSSIRTKNTCGGERAYQFCRRLLFDFQAWHARRLPALQRKAFAPLSRRVRSPLQLSRGARLQRHRPHPRRDPWRRRQAVDVPAISLSRILNTKQCNSSDGAGKEKNK